MHKYSSVICAMVVAAGVVAAQPSGAEAKQQLQQQIGEIKASMAQSKAALRTYTWVESTEVSLKGEVKKQSQKQCSYGADGKLVKVAVGEPGAAKSGKKKGLKGKIVDKKVGEMKEYMDRATSLVKRYAPPDPEKMKAAFQNGNATLTRGDGIATVVFKSYFKPGDQLTLTFDTKAKALRVYDVQTYLDKPEDVTTLNARFTALADGTNFNSETLLDVTAKKIQVKITNFGHRKAGQ